MFPYRCSQNIFDAIWKTHIATKSLGPLCSEFFGSEPGYFAININEKCSLIFADIWLRFRVVKMWLNSF